MRNKRNLLRYQNSLRHNKKKESYVCRNTKYLFLRIELHLIIKIIMYSLLPCHKVWMEKRNKKVFNKRYILGSRQSSCTFQVERWKVLMRVMVEKKKKGDGDKRNGLKEKNRFFEWIQGKIGRWRSQDMFKVHLQLVCFVFPALIMRWVGIREKPSFALVIKN